MCRKMEIQKSLITYNFILTTYTPITVPFMHLYTLGKYHRYKLLIKQYQSYNAKKGLSRQHIGVTLCHAYSVIFFSSYIMFVDTYIHLCTETS